MWKSLSLTQQSVSLHFTKRSLRLVLVPMIAATLVAMAGIVLRSSTGAAVSERTLPQGQGVVPAQTIRFTIYPEGILPATATVHKGLVSIAIEDLAGAEAGLLVERVGEQGSRVMGSVRRSNHHWRGRSSIELSPGLYRLRLANDRTTAALLTVEP